MYEIQAAKINSRGAVKGAVIVFAGTIIAAIITTARTTRNDSEPEYGRPPLRTPTWPGAGERGSPPPTAAPVLPPTTPDYSSSTRIVELSPVPAPPRSPSTPAILRLLEPPQVSLTIENRLVAPIRVFDPMSPAQIILVPARTRVLLRVPLVPKDLEFEVIGTAGTAPPMRGAFASVAAGKNLNITSRIGLAQYVSLSLRNSSHEAFQVRLENDVESQTVAFLPQFSVIHLGYTSIDSISSIVLIPTLGYSQALVWSLLEGRDDSVRSLIDIDTGVLELECREDYLD